MSGIVSVWRYLLGTAVGGAWVLTANCATAQITPDRSLPNNSSVTINGSTFNITGGTQAGRNLFHSFQQFSVPTNNTAIFNNGLDIQNIITRVTGGGISNIDGILRASGGANLFLINPAGIVFGKNARLNIGGSFVASTANSIKFADGFEYSATTPQTPPLLTISVPSGLQFGTNPGKINVQGSGHNLTFDPNTGKTILADSLGLQVPLGKTLALVGGDVALDGGNLRTESGRIELGSVKSPSLVNLSATNAGFALDYSGVKNFGDISLFNKASADTSGSRGGEVQVQTNKLSLRDGSAILSITQGSGNGGNFTVKAKESIELKGKSADSQYVSSLSVENQGSGHGGDVNINTGKLIATDGAYIQSYAFSGKGGNLNVSASDSVELVGKITLVGGSSSISGLFTGTSGTGDSGNLTINTENLTLRQGAQISSATYGAGNAGNLTINAGQITSKNRSLISSATFDAGNGGNITIGTRKLVSQDGSWITTSTYDTGKAGDLTVRASESVELSGDKPISKSNNSGGPGGLFAQAENTTSGNARGGTLTVETQHLSISNGSKVQAASFGNASSGTVIVRATDIDIFNTPNSTNSFSTTISAGLSTDPRNVQPSKGATGSVIIETARLRIMNGGKVQTSSFGIGSAGDLTIRASDYIEVTGVNSSIDASIKQGAVGKGGNVNIETGNLIVRNSGIVNVGAEKPGSAGNLNITARSILLDNKGSISANTTSGEGNITINSQALVLRNSSKITTNATGTGTGGNITINTPNGFVVATPNENNDITANAFFGSGGVVKINALGIYNFNQRSLEDLERLLGTKNPNELDPQRLPTNDITAVSLTSPTLSGQVNIITPDIDPSRGLIPLPTVTEQNIKLVSSGCAAFNEAEGGSQFIITGRGGLPPGPDQPLTSEAIWTDTRLPVTTAQQHLHKTHAAKPKPQPIAIIPATGWVRNNKGEVTLISSATNATVVNTPTSCPIR